ncbi:hypothetical protein Bca4012_015177 [Brassica carinata]
MKPVYCGNFEYDARESDLERLFRKYGKVDRVDMKAATLVEFKIIYISLDFSNSIRRLVIDTVLKPGRTPTHKLNGLFWEQHLLCTLESGETFAFVQYEVQEDATRALDATNNREKEGALTMAEEELVRLLPTERTGRVLVMGEDVAQVLTKERDVKVRGNESPRRRERYSHSPNNKRETLKKGK